MCCGIHRLPMLINEILERKKEREKRNDPSLCLWLGGIEEKCNPRGKSPKLRLLTVSKRFLGF